MYLASIRITNYRCFADQVIEFCPGVNVLIGENNAGKTTVISALGLILEQRHRRRLTYFDFHQPMADVTAPPRIAITVAFRSTPDDTIEDRALVAEWLTKLDRPWEATLTFIFALEPEDEAACTKALEAIPKDDEEEYRRVMDSFLPRYVGHIYGGDPKNVLAANRDMIEKIDFQVLDALRDAERELFSGSNPLLKRILRQIRDSGKDDTQRANSDKEFRKLSAQLGQHLRSRLTLDPLLSFVTDTGALEGGKPTLKDEIAEDDILSALHLYVENEGMSVPAERNGLGYNNLIYVSLVLASVDNDADPAKKGPNATTFPILCIEEPEAHLHPSLQYKLLKHLQERVTPKKRTRQVFITTHSTHITSASGLDHLICLNVTPAGTQHVAYPGRCFPETAEGKTSKAYVERYLDATKSDLLFAKGIVFVEGMAELLLLPVTADQIGCSFATHHVALISVGGLTFKHFLPLFEAGLSPDRLKYALNRPVACLLDGDCTRKANEEHGKFKECWPYQLDKDPTYEYRATSPAVANLQTLCTGCEHIVVRHTTKTLEYDLAYNNHSSTFLVTVACTYHKELTELMATPALVPELLAKNVIDEELGDLNAIADAAQRERHRVASCYLRCVEESKGEHAFALAQQLRQAKADGRQGITLPSSIEAVIRHAARRPKPPHPPGNTLT
jgi:putative ATP-dependent endonuclease of OLD family